MRIAVATLVLLTLGLGTASAQTASCAVPAAGANACLCVYAPTQPVALLDQPAGDIRKSSQNGYVQVAVPTPLVVGDQVLFSSGTGLFKVANCQQPVGPNASLVIRALDNGCNCAQVVTRRAFLPQGENMPRALGGGIVGLMALKILAHPVSP